MNNANDFYDILEAFLQGRFTTTDYVLTFIAIYLTAGFSWAVYVRTVKFDTLPYRMTEDEALELLGIKKEDLRPQQNRNEMCACGSGKKYKNCCGTAATKQNHIMELTKDHYTIFLRYAKKTNLPQYYFFYPFIWLENRSVNKYIKKNAKKRTDATSS